MKNLIPALLAFIIFSVSPPAEARRGLFHKVVNVAGAPFWALGFTATMVVGTFAVPFVHGVEYFQTHPFVGDR